MEQLKSLEALEQKDNFGPDNCLYTGVQDEELKKILSSQFSVVIEKFKATCQSNVSSDEYLKLLKETIKTFDRNSLDTEDAENLALNFEKIMDCIGLESSEGILNEWMYGFDLPLD